MLNFKCLQKAKPKDVKVVASGNFLDSLNQIDNIRVVRNEKHEKIGDLEKVQVTAPQPEVKPEKGLPTMKELKVMAAGSFLDSLNQIDNIRVTKVAERNQSREEISLKSYQEAITIIN